MENPDEVFEDLMYYEEVALTSKKYRKILDEFGLQNWLVHVVNAKGARSGKLAEKISKCERFKELIKTNKLSYVDFVKLEMFKNKKKAKEKGAIYVGKSKNGYRYFYDFSKNKRISKNKILNFFLNSVNVANLTKNKELAKEKKIIYAGNLKNGYRYFYDFSKNKRISKNKIIEIFLSKNLKI